MSLFCTNNNTLSLTDFNPINKWALDNKGPKWSNKDEPKYIVDQTTKKKYFNESKTTIRFKCTLLTLGTAVMQTIHFTAGVIFKILKTVFLYHLWPSNLRKNFEKKRFDPIKDQVEKELLNRINDKALFSEEDKSLLFNSIKPKNLFTRLYNKIFFGSIDIKYSAKTEEEKKTSFQQLFSNLKISCSPQEDDKPDQKKKSLSKLALAFLDIFEKKESEIFNTGKNAPLLMKYTIYEAISEMGKDILSIIFFPILLLGMQLSAIYGIVNPLDGRKLYASFEKAADNPKLLAPCFQPNPEKHFFGGDINKKNSF